MEEEQKVGKRLPAPGRPAYAETRPTPQPAPAPRPVPTAAPQSARRAPEPAPERSQEWEGTEPVSENVAPRARPLPGVPMAGMRTGTARPDPAPTPAPAEGPGQELDFGADIGTRPAARSAPAPAPAPRARTAPAEGEYEEQEAEAGEAVDDTPARMYSTRRALAEKQLGEDAKRRSRDAEDASGPDSLKGRTEAWRKLVKAKEAEGKSPYVMRIVKGSIFPVLYLVISLQLLRRYTYEYSEYYSFEQMYILLGFALGAVSLLLISARGMLRARRLRMPIVLSDRGVVVGVGLFLAVSIFLAFFYSLSSAWQFSIGFFAAGLLTPLLGFAIEKGSKGMFWVKEPREDEGTGKRLLEFTPVAGS